MRNVILGLILVLVGGGAASAQEAMSAREARALLFGVDMRGTQDPTGLPWRECIDINGNTKYWFADLAPDQGRLRVREDGAACFSYASSQFQGEACWFVKRLSRTQLRFESAQGSGAAFITTSIRRVRTCQGGEVPVS